MELPIGATLCLGFGALDTAIFSTDIVVTPEWSPQEQSEKTGPRMYFVVASGVVAVITSMSLLLRGYVRG